MRVAWIYPISRRCGISFYSQKYLAALRPLIEIVEADSHGGWPPGVIDSCDIVHVQYETGLFLRGRRDLFTPLCASIRRPVVVSLHEVYRRFPGVYPRGEIRGPLGPLRRAIYDLRHPAVTALARHERACFHARAVLVHAPWQQQVLVEKGLPAGRIRVLPYPLSPVAGPPPAIDGSAPAVRLGSLGFLNVNYDYGLLMQSLAALQRPWSFVWIGGPRRDEDRPLLRRIEAEVRSRGWNDRFRVTGWVEDPERDRLLRDIDVYLALFADRSSSESLATAVSALRPIVATRLPMTEDLNTPAELMSVVDSRVDSVVAGIDRLTSDGGYRGSLLSRLQAYVTASGYDALAGRLVDIYSQILERTD